ncbi:MAG: restriction endonuclease [bacterium]|nr:restriction endonuclease [bacterium]
MRITNSEIADYALRLLENLRGEAGKTQLNHMIYDAFDDGEDPERRERLAAQTRQVLEALEIMGVLKILKQGYQLLAIPQKDEIQEEKLAEAIEQKAEQERKKVQKTQEEREEEAKQLLLETLRKMDDRAFEYLIAKVMRVCGFEFTPGQGTADDGVDGEGYYTVNELLRYKVIVQCKRYADGHTIGNKYIRDLRGAVSTKAHKGLFVTTSTFTRMARAEASLHPLIDLLDGDDLADLIFRHKIGIEQDEEGNYQLSKEYYDEKGFQM